MNRTTIKPATLFGLGALALIIIYIIYKFLELRKHVAELELQIQVFLYDKYGKSTEVVSIEINQLGNEFSDDEDTAKNLVRARELYEQGELQESVRKLVVLIESLLKEKARKENPDWFKSDGSTERAGLMYFVNKFKGLNYFNELEIRLIICAKDIRNGESHSSNFKETDVKYHLAILGSIEILKKLVPEKKQLSLTA